MACGQFSIFGAIEENGRPGFRGSAGMKRRLKERLFR
jgi:hypothetical protein